MVEVCTLKVFVIVLIKCRIITYSFAVTIDFFTESVEILTVSFFKRDTLLAYCLSRINSQRYDIQNCACLVSTHQSMLLIQILMSRYQRLTNLRKSQLPI